MNKPDKADWPVWAVDTFYDNNLQQWLYKDALGNVKDEKHKFVKGYSGNKSGVSSEVVKRIQQIRSMSTEALVDIGIPRVIKELSEKDLTTKELVSLVRLLVDIGVPQQTEDVGTHNQAMPQIVISKEAFEEARKRDAEYLADEDSDIPE